MIAGERTGAATGSNADGGFVVTSEAYSGPFDVLLGLLADRRLDLTEVSLSTVTGEFLAYVGAMDLTHGMDEASAFIDVASILVEAKSVAILPDAGSGERDDPGMEALRDRDLLFARLLQYKAFKEAGIEFRKRMEANGFRPHPGCMDGAVRAMLPDVVWTLGTDELAHIAARALSNAPVDEVSTRQLHVPLVDLRRQAALVRDRLRSLPVGGSVTFDDLTSDADSSLIVVARFLAVLAFFKQGVVQFKQDRPYGPLHLRWAVDAHGRRPDDAVVTFDEGDFA